MINTPLFTEEQFQQGEAEYAQACEDFGFPVDESDCDIEEFSARSEYLTYVSTDIFPDMDDTDIPF